MLIRRTPHSHKVLIDESLGDPTTFTGSVVKLIITLIIAVSETAVTNNPSVPASFYSFTLLKVVSSGELSFNKKPSVLAFIKQTDCIIQFFRLILFY